MKSVRMILKKLWLKASYESTLVAKVGKALPSERNTCSEKSFSKQGCWRKFSPLSRVLFNKFHISRAFSSLAAKFYFETIENTIVLSKLLKAIVKHNRLPRKDFIEQWRFSLTKNNAIYNTAAGWERILHFRLISQLIPWTDSLSSATEQHSRADLNRSR